MHEDEEAHWGQTVNCLTYEGVCLNLKGKILWRLPRVLVEQW